MWVFLLILFLPSILINLLFYGVIAFVFGLWFRPAFGITGIRLALARIGAAVLFVAACAAPAQLTRASFKERATSEGGIHVSGTKPKPGGFLNENGPAYCDDICQELLLRKTVPFYETIWHGEIRRFHLVVGHEECAVVRKALETGKRVENMSDFSRFPEAIAYDRCYRTEIDTAVRASTRLREYKIDSPFSARRVEITTVNADGSTQALAWGEAASLKTPILPVIFVVPWPNIFKEKDLYFTRIEHYDYPAREVIIVDLFDIDLSKKVSPPSDSIPALFKNLTTGPKVAKAAITALHLVQRDLASDKSDTAPDWLPALIQATADLNGKLRGEAFEIIGDYGPAARSALPLLHRAIAGSDVDKPAAIVAEARIAPSDVDLRQLTAMMNASQSGVDNAARKAAQIIGAPAVPHLVTLLSNKARPTPSAAVSALGCIDVADATADKILVDIAADISNPAHWAAIQALGNRRIVDGVPILISRLDIHSSIAHDSLVLIGPAAVPQLITALDTSHGPGLIVRVLEGIGPAALPALQAVEQPNRYIVSAVEAIAARPTTGDFLRQHRHPRCRLAQPAD